MSNATIIAALDAAVLAWAGKPITTTVHGKSVTYRSLTELIEARTYYANLESTTSGATGFQLQRMKAGGFST